MSEQTVYIVDVHHSFTLQEFPCRPLQGWVRTYLKNNEIIGFIFETVSKR